MGTLAPTRGGKQGRDQGAGPRRVFPSLLVIVFVRDARFTKWECKSRLCGCSVNLPSSQFLVSLPNLFLSLFEIQIEMPQLDKLTYFSQFFWLCLLLFTFYILLFNNNNGILGISRILKLRNQLLSHRGNKIQSKDPKNLEDISRKGFSTGLSYMYSGSRL